MASPRLPQLTLKYKTYLKRAVVNALQEVFNNHPDTYLRYRPDTQQAGMFRGTHVTIEYPITERANYPTIVVGFNERKIENFGVGHREWFWNEGQQAMPFRHYGYWGDINFRVIALSSYDRDLVTDSLFEIIAMGELMPYANSFLEDVYAPEEDTFQQGHIININNDQINPQGESREPPPWGAEDTLIYTSGYAIGAFGQVYSLPPDVKPLVPIERVDIFPYIKEQGDPIPTGDPTDPAPWFGGDRPYGHLP